MRGIHLEWNPVDEQLESLRALVEELRREVGELRAENADRRQQVSSLKCDVGYWKSRHADAVERNTRLQAELNDAKRRDYSHLPVRTCRFALPRLMFLPTPKSAAAVDCRSKGWGTMRTVNRSKSNAASHA